MKSLPVLKRLLVLFLAMFISLSSFCMPSSASSYPGMFADLIRVPSDDLTGVFSCFYTVNPKKPGRATAIATITMGPTFDSRSKIKSLETLTGEVEFRRGLTSTSSILLDRKPLRTNPKLLFSPTSKFGGAAMRFSSGFLNPEVLYAKLVDGKVSYITKKGTTEKIVNRLDKQPAVICFPQVETDRRQKKLAQEWSTETVRDIKPELEFLNAVSRVGSYWDGMRETSQNTIGAFFAAVLFILSGGKAGGWIQ